MWTDVGKKLHTNVIMYMYRYIYIEREREMYICIYVRIQADVGAQLPGPQRKSHGGAVLQLGMTQEGEAQDDGLFLCC